MKPLVIVAAAAFTLASCGSYGPAAHPGGGPLCFGATWPSSPYQQPIGPPTRTVTIPRECCFIPEPMGGQVRCPGSTLSWTVFRKPASAVTVLEELVVAHRNPKSARNYERQVTCALVGVETSCYQFATETIPGPPQYRRTLLGAVTVDGQGLVAACQYYPGAGLPALCRQIFTP